MFPINFIDTKIIEDIIAWNAVRYKQEYSTDLTLKLLHEEVDEADKAAKANDIVEYCDGLGDVFFVAIGALWKQGFSKHRIYEILTNPNVVMPLPAGLVWLSFDQRPIVLAWIAFSAFWYLENCLQSPQAASDIIIAICNSNNTKTVIKTVTNEKANLDKGVNFVPPTKAIQDIIALYTITEAPNGLC